MDFFQAIMLGVVEGLTEFLPVSSTGHLILASHALGIPDTAFVKSFEIAIQLGAMCAVVALYWRSFLDIEVLKRIGAAFVPTAVIGFALYAFIKEFLIGNEIVVLLALALGGVALIVFELLHTEREDAAEDIAHIPYSYAFGVGLFQSLAMIPGVSRSGATIIGGLILGFKRATIVQFSFLLAVPTMFAATALDLTRSYAVFSSADVVTLGIGFTTAFLIAIAAIRFFLAFIKTHTFIPFGIYRIALAAVFFLLFI